MVHPRLALTRSSLEDSMSNFTLRKTPPTGYDMKSTTHRTTSSRQQEFQELCKRRAFLQDNSWIKKRPEEEREGVERRDENYGRVVLSRHNSHDALDKNKHQDDEPKATISRYRSDDTLDRSLSTFKSPETTKTQPTVSFSAVTTTIPASTSAATPVKKKRQSWFPPPPPGYHAAPSPGASRREPTVHPPIPPKPSSPISSPHMLRRDNRQICPPKPGVYAETNRSAERSIRSQDLENIVKVATSLQKTDKGEELDHLIKMNKSLNRNQGLDGLFRTNPQTERTEKRAKSLESLIFLNARMDKDGKRNQTLSLMKENPRMVANSKGREDFGSVIKVNSKESENTTGKQDLSGHIKMNSETNKNIKRGQSLDNLIKVTLEDKRSSPGSKELDNLIKVTPRTEKSGRGDKSLDSLIKVTPETKRIKQGCDRDLDELIKVNPKAVKNITRNQDLDKLIKVNPETLTKNRRNQDLDNLIKVNSEVIRRNHSPDSDNLVKGNPSALRNSKRDQDTKNITEVNSNVSKNKNGRQEDHTSGYSNALNNQTTKTTANSYETRKKLSAETRPAGMKDTVVYTRTFVENSKSPKAGNPENISGKYIQTVYSTSDRSVIERDMCTYCRKPLGTETKMILDELQICCHSTCFKCEICKKPLENLQAGDSIWIYKQTIHCEPCYSKVIAKWIQ